MNISFPDRIPSFHGIHHYTSNQSPLVPSPLAKLPLGAIRPQGWLRQQLCLMEDGLTGHLDETGLFLTESNGWLHPENTRYTIRRENNTFAPGENFSPL